MEKPDYLTNTASTSVNDTQKRLPCVFQTQMMDPIGNKNCMAVLGSIPELGSWDRLYPVMARPHGDRVWRMRVDLPPDIAIEYKWIIYNKFVYHIVEYEPGDNRKIRIIDTSVLVEDFEDGVQVITEIKRDEADKLMNQIGASVVSASKNVTDPNKTTSKYMPTGQGPFEYDEALVQMVKELNPRIYVPEEYKTGVLKKSLTSESFENTNQLDGKHGSYGEKKTEFDNPLKQRKSSDYGLEISLLDVEKETRAMSVGGVEEKTEEGVWGKVKGFVSKHKDRIVKAGLCTGLAVSAVMLYKKLF